MGKIELEVEIKSSPEKFWEGICDSTVLFPKIFPEQYKSIEIVEGDGKSVGTCPSRDIWRSNSFQIFTATLQISPKGDGSSIKFSVEFEKASDEVPDPDLILELAMKTFSEFDAYLLKA
ncbi:hypothetical protein MKW92_031645 [Papaver armeniacum]|nr:hypothetical protein MKW92_031645 [Papaver armeniacum]